MPTSFFRESRLLSRSLEMPSEQVPAQGDGNQPEDSQHFRKRLQNLEFQKDAEQQKFSEHYRQQLKEVEESLNTKSTPNTFVMKNLGPRDTAYLQFDRYVDPTCVGPDCVKIASSDYTITRSKDGTVTVDSSIPFSYRTAEGRWQRFTSGASETVKSEKVQQETRPEARETSLLNPIPSPRKGWKAYQAAIPTGRAFSVRIETYPHPIQIAANVVSCGAPDPSIGFYIRRTRSTEPGMDTAIIEACQKVTDATIES